MKKGMQEHGAGDSKKFAVRPFSAIKGLVVDSAPVTPKPALVPAPREQPRNQEEDDLLFLAEMDGVARIHTINTVRRNLAVAVVPGQPSQTPEPDESRIFIDALREMKLDVNFAEAITRDEEPVPPRKVSRMRQLRRGTIRLNLEIDLHGLTREEAVEALASFIAAAARRGQQAVLVITGKGVHSAAEPVIQGAIADWLAREGKKWVAEFMPAPQHMGGNGAFVVFLKGLNRES